jgi:hypothetical protein
MSLGLWQPQGALSGFSATAGNASVRYDANPQILPANGDGKIFKMWYAEGPWRRTKLCRISRRKNVDEVFRYRKLRFQEGDLIQLFSPVISQRVETLRVSAQICEPVNSTGRPALRLSGPKTLLELACVTTSTTPAESGLSPFQDKAATKGERNSWNK